ncbi:hypothetical protein M011DRAFT_472076 [Sporormia fimetaria CBS 119925]|uniref:Pal1-domain-containing protein n=1 Tax=Sporormia fimetaria CBS 119925 TaxID=1340428 RepID=A0A6A6UWI1_9PLEO|nr:hypothetical protein M011DRAFT_472076 [Sporormia fimetaria CBS 119925]
MGTDKDFVTAQHSVIDPLIEPDPSDETGLNSHFRSTYAPQPGGPTPPNSAGLKGPESTRVQTNYTGSSVETNPYRRARASSSAKASPTVSYGEVYPQATPSRSSGYPSPPESASPRRSHFTEEFGSVRKGRPRGNSQPMAYQTPQHQSGLGRSGSLRERYPGDKSHRPLEIIKKDTKAAHRAHHLRKKNFQGADVIDRLDASGGKYHHEGPYDAANISRNLSWTHSPIAAVQDSTEEALRATPRENIVDSVTKHRPLEGVADIPPGMPDKFGRVLDYQEGADLQREPGGDYRRWPGQEYRPDDLKGKGEPSFTVDKALKDHKTYGDTGTEMTTRHRNHSLGACDAPESVPLQDPFSDNQGVHRSNTTGKSVGSTLKKRFGSIRRRKVEA